MAAPSILCSDCVAMFNQKESVTTDIIFGAYIPLNSRLNRYLFAAATGQLPPEAESVRDCQFCAFVINLIRTVGITKNHGFISAAAKEYRRPCLIPYNYGGMHEHHSVTWQAMLNGKVLHGDKGNFILCEARGARMQNIRPLDLESTSTKSHASFEMLTQWIKTCEFSHERCRSILSDMPAENVSDFPARLIRLNSTSTPWTIHLIETSDHPTILESDRLYATLSYCWGPSPTFKKLLKANLQELKAGLSIDTLSKTFREAFSAISKLGLSLIWIDALCIIQDSDEDWKIESMKMSQVYSGAFVNLAAAASSDADAHGGLFRERDPFVINPVQVDLKWPGYLEGSYYCVPQDAWVSAIDCSPLIGRAWAFQERLLSVRTVYFARDQLYWECEQLCASEVFPNGGPWDPGFRENMYQGSKRLPRGMDLNPDGRIKDQYGLLQPRLARSSTTTSEFLFVWALIVEQYTKCRLTYGKDRLPAISGIANQVSNQETQSDYVLGLWKQHLPLLLLWHNTIGNDKALTLASSTTTSSPAPSWSWASHLNPVLYPLIFKSIGEPEIYIEVLKISAPHGVTQHGIGDDFDGRLQVKGKLCEVKLLTTFGKNEEVKMLFAGYGLQTADHCDIFLDEDYAFATKSQTFCLKVASGYIVKGLEGGDMYICGLLLAHKGRKGEYKRIGYFSIVTEKLPRSWRADRWLSRGSRPSRLRDRQGLQDELFTSQQIDEMFYQDIDGEANYTISIL